MTKMTNAAAALLSDGPDRDGENCRPGRHRRGAVPIDSRIPDIRPFRPFPRHRRSDRPGRAGPHTRGAFTLQLELQLS